MIEQRCYNWHCGRFLTEADKTDFCGCLREKILLPHHLCNECFSKFDSQKMNGRWRLIGNHLGINEGKGKPGDSDRYTESVDEWIGWQGESK